MEFDQIHASKRKTCLGKFIECKIGSSLTKSVRWYHMQNRFPNVNLGKKEISF